MNYIEGNLIAQGLKIVWSLQVAVALVGLVK